MAEANTISSITGTAKLPEKADFLKKNIMLLCVLIAVVGLIGNGIVIVFFCYKPRISRYTLYFQNITFANIIVIIDVFVVFQRIYLHIVSKLYTIHIVEMLQTLGYNTRFYILTAICVERCHIIFWPACNKHCRPQHLTDVVCGILWGLSCLTSVVYNLACSPDFITTYNQFAISCKTSSIIKIVLDIVIFLPFMGLATLAILIKTRTQRVPLARLEVTILATVALYFLTDTPIRICHSIVHWFQNIDALLLVAITQLFDSINCTAYPLIFVIVGCWKKPSEEPIFLFFERALESEENMTETTEVDKE